MHRTPRKIRVHNKNVIAVSPAFLEEGRGGRGVGTGTGTGTGTGEESCRIFFFCLPISRPVPSSLKRLVIEPKKDGSKEIHRVFIMVIGLSGV